jgi:hypothetical protein
MCLHPINFAVNVTILNEICFEHYTTIDAIPSYSLISKHLYDQYNVGRTSVVGAVLSPIRRVQKVCVRAFL